MVKSELELFESFLLSFFLSFHSILISLRLLVPGASFLSSFSRTGRSPSVEPELGGWERPVGTTMDETGPSHLTVFMEGLVRLVPISYRPVNVVKQRRENEAWDMIHSIPASFHLRFLSAFITFIISLLQLLDHGRS